MDTNQTGRLDRVETEVSTIRSEMGSVIRDVGSLKADVRGLGSVLGRIEQSMLRAQDRDENKEDRSKPNVVAIISVLITIISIIVGGAWVIGGQLARQDERSVWIERIVSKSEQRLWVGHNGGTTNGESRQEEK